MFIHERPGWPEFIWSNAELTEALAAVRFRQGRLLGRGEAMLGSWQDMATLDNITQDVVRSSQIEGEQLPDLEVRSSIARRLGIDIGGLMPSSRHVDGIVDVLLDATRNAGDPLTEERLFRWHSWLFPSGRDPRGAIRAGAWRTDDRGPMTVVSGPLGGERIHFEASSANRLDVEMSRFLAWFNLESELDAVLKSAIAHLWFVTIHPFEDGNGRIARAIGDLALARADGTSRRFYSITAQIQRERLAYYHQLEAAQRGTLEITPWLSWFLEMLDQALAVAETDFERIEFRTRFWQAVADVPMNERQRSMIERLLDGFSGKLTAAKWASLTKTSPDTALRDINALIEHGVLARDSSGGRSTSYSLALEPGGDSLDTR